MSVIPNISIQWGYLLAWPRGGQPASRDQFPNWFQQGISLGSFTAKMPNSHQRTASRLGVTFISHQYWCHFLSTGEPFVVSEGQLLPCGSVAFLWPGYLPCQALCTTKNTHEHGLLVLLGAMQWWRAPSGTGVRVNQARQHRGINVTLPHHTAVALRRPTSSRPSDGASGIKRKVWSPGLLFWKTTKLLRRLLPC